MIQSLILGLEELGKSDLLWSVVGRNMNTKGASGELSAENGIQQRDHMVLVRSHGILWIRCILMCGGWLNLLITNLNIYLRIFLS